MHMDHSNHSWTERSYPWCFLCLCFFPHFPPDPIPWGLAKSISTAKEYIEKPRRAKHPASRATLYAKMTGPPWCVICALTWSSPDRLSDEMSGRKSGELSCSNDGDLWNTRDSNRSKAFEERVRCKIRIIADATATYPGNTRVSERKLPTDIKRLMSERQRCDPYELTRLFSQGMTRRWASSSNLWVEVQFEYRRELRRLLWLKRWLLHSGDWTKYDSCRETAGDRIFGQSEPNSNKVGPNYERPIAQDEFQKSDSDCHQQISTSIYYQVYST
jgi:hypothetical protein